MAKDRNKALFGKSSSLTIPKAIRGRGAIEITGEQWMSQLTSLPEKIDMAVLDYTIALRQRAYRVFEGSFKYKKFNSAGAPHWAPITDYTWESRKRHVAGNYKLGGEIMTRHKDVLKRKGTGKYYKIPLDRNKILVEFGYLKRALSQTQISQSSPFIQSVYIDRGIAATNPIHRKIQAEYVAWHNNPSPGMTYGKSGVKFKKRQFMGHSSLIVGPNGFIEKYEVRYLFDTVFGNFK